MPNPQSGTFLNSRRPATSTSSAWRLWLRLVLAGLALMAELSGAGGARSSLGSQSSHAVHGAADAQTQKGLYFQFPIGSRWTYTWWHKTQEGSGANPTQVNSSEGTYSDEVLGVDDRYAPSVQIVSIKRTGESPNETSCDLDEPQSGGAKGPAEFWIVTNTWMVFTSCKLDEALELASKLKSPPSESGVTETPDFVFPMKVGSFWGRDPSSAKRADTMYEWFVNKLRDVKVPAGNFNNCFDMTYVTLPDGEVKTICPGVGLVEDEYTHHGTLDEYEIQLKEFRSGRSVFER